MRITAAPIVLFIFVLLAILLSCIPTVDPPPPDRLSAPYITEYRIIAEPDYTNEYHETIYLKWAPDTTDPISPISYEIIRQADTDSFPTFIRNIPDTINKISEPTYKFDDLDRSTEHLIFYRIFAYDSLGRMGDTSAICSVSLARNITLMHPGNIMSDPAGKEYFEWEIPEGIVNQNISHIYLWKNDSLIWESDSVWYYSGGVARYPKKSLPTPLSPLIKNNYYYWGIELSIIDIHYPLSITIRNFYVE